MGKQGETGPIKTEHIDLKKLEAKMKIEKQVRQDKLEQIKPKKFKFIPHTLNLIEKVAENKMAIDETTKTDLRMSGKIMSYAQSSINKL